MFLCSMSSSSSFGLCPSKPKFSSVGESLVLTGVKNEKPIRGFLKRRTMSINGFPIQILLPKSNKSGQK